VPDFPSALRTAVRQDPDVMMIGELRDRETVLAGIQAAETGHLVFVTLHTADTMQAFEVAGVALAFLHREDACPPAQAGKLCRVWSLPGRVFPIFSFIKFRLFRIAQPPIFSIPGEN